MLLPFFMIMGAIPRLPLAVVNIDSYSQHMKWLSRDNAARRLGVKPATLYAYVSRGLITAARSPANPRESVYASADIDALKSRHRDARRPREIARHAIAWGEPVLESAIATIADGRLFYRGQDAVKLSAHATLEETARIIWAMPQDWAPTRPRPVAVSGATPKARGLAFLARRTAESAPAFGRTRAHLAHEAHDLLTLMADAMTNEPGDAPWHQRLAAMWNVKPRDAQLIRRALVLVADHELNPSTFAARVTASTGASLAAACLSGFATLTGPLHGEAAARALSFLQACENNGTREAMRELLARGEVPPAAGHTLYPHGDPRAASLLAALKPRPLLAEAINAVESTTGKPPNIDMALAALTLQLDLPRDAPFVIFAAGRTAGWLAHAMEQCGSNTPIRPRATYNGPPPQL